MQPPSLKFMRRLALAGAAAAQHRLLKRLPCGQRLRMTAATVWCFSVQACFTIAFSWSPTMLLYSDAADVLDAAANAGERA